MSENKYLESTIKEIDLEKGIIYINKINSSQRNDFIAIKKYYEKTLSSEDLASLRVGTKVKFKEFKTEKAYIAQELTVIHDKELPVSHGLSEIKYLESTIKEIDLEKGIIYINKINSSQRNDFIAIKKYYEKTLSSEDLASLRVGTKVKFKEFKTEKAYIAQELDIVRDFKNIDDIRNYDSIKNNEDNIQQNKKGMTEDFNLANSIESIFKNRLSYIKNGADFEDVTFLILKFLSISEIYTIPRNRQGGQPDGFFKCLSIATQTPKLEVVYDCTLKPKHLWQSEKEKQIEAYLGYITKTQRDVSYDYIDKNGQSSTFKQTVTLNNNSDKQIWIITKDCTRLIENKQYEIIQNNNAISLDIAIKEINIYDLLNILSNRLKKSDFVKIDSVTDELRYLGSD